MSVMVKVEKNATETKRSFFCTDRGTNNSM